MDMSNNKDKIRILRVKPIYITNEEDLKYANDGAKIGDVKTWEFEIGLPNNLMCNYRICSLEFDSSPRFYCENNNTYDIETKELHSNINLQKINREDIHNAMADYIVNNPKMFGSLYEWALVYVRTYECLKTNIELSDFSEEQYITLPSGKEVYFRLCTYADKIGSFKDIDYYLTYDNNFNSSESLSFLAANAVNMDAVEKQNQKSKEDLITYYQEKDTAELLETPHELLTEEDHDTLSFFSDWHKDVFGYRPRGLNNGVETYLENIKETEELDLD